MSEEITNLWKKREVVRLECPGGSICLVTRPGPALGLRIARLQRTLKPLLDASKAENGESLESAQARALESLDDEGEQSALAVARETVVAAVVEPRLYLNPNADQLGVDDIEPRDFWHIFNWATAGARSVPVALQGGETTTVEAVESFPRAEAAGAGTGNHGGHVSRSQPGRAAKNRRPGSRG